MADSVLRDAAGSRCRRGGIARPVVGRRRPMTGMRRHVEGAEREADRGAPLVMGGDRQPAAVALDDPLDDG